MTQDFQRAAVELAEAICTLWAVSQNSETITFKRDHIEAIFKMATELREKAGQ